MINISNLKIKKRNWISLKRRSKWLKRSYFHLVTKVIRFLQLGLRLTVIGKIWFKKLSTNGITRQKWFKFSNWSILPKATLGKKYYVFASMKFIMKPNKAKYKMNNGHSLSVSWFNWGRYRKWQKFFGH